MATAFSELGDETFGEKLRRARSRRGLGLKEAAYRVSALFAPASIHTIQRLEFLDEAPSDRRRRITAAAYVAALGFDPVTFGIDLDGLPTMTLRTIEALADDSAKLAKKGALISALDVPDRTLAA